MDKRLEELLSFPIVIDDSTAESMTFVNNTRSAKQTSEKETAISGKLEAIIVAVNEISQMVTIKDDQDELAIILKRLQNMKSRYDYLVDTVDKENARIETARIETVHKILTSISTRHRKTVSDRQKKQSSFTERTADVKSRIVELIRYERALQVYKPNVKTQKILASQQSNIGL